MLGMGEPLPNFTRQLFAVLEGNYGQLPAVWEELYTTHAAAVIDKAIHPKLDSIEEIAALQNRAVVIDSDGCVYQRVCGVWLLAGGHEPCEPAVMHLPAKVLYAGLPDGCSTGADMCAPARLPNPEEADPMSVVRRLTQWTVDQGTPEWAQMLKVSEEAGEAAQAYLRHVKQPPADAPDPWSGQDVVYELADTAIAALVAIQRINHWDAEVALTARLDILRQRYLTEGA